MAIKPASTTILKSKQRLLLLAAVITALLGALVFSVYYYYASKPERVLREALVKNFSNEKRSRTVTLQFQDLKQRLQLQVQIKNAPTLGSYESPAVIRVVVFGQTIEIPATVRYVDGQYYLKVGDASKQLNAVRTSTSPLAAYVDYLQDIITPLQQNWVVVDVIPNDLLTAQCREEVGKIRATNRDVSGIEAAARDSGLLTSFDAASKANGEYRYSLMLQADKMPVFARQIATNATAWNISASCKKALIKNLTEVFSNGDKEGEYSLEISVNAESKMITKIVSTDARAIRTVTYSNFGTAVDGAEATKPPDAKSLSTTLKQIPFLQ